MKTMTLSKRLVALLCCLAVCVACSVAALGISLASRAQADDASEDGIVQLTEEAATDNYVIEEEIPAPPEDIVADEPYQGDEPAGTEEIPAPEEEPASGEPVETAESESSDIPEEPTESDTQLAVSDEADGTEPAGSDEPDSTEPSETDPAGTDEADGASDAAEPDGDPADEADASGEADADDEADNDQIVEADADDEADDDEADAEDANDEEKADADDEYGIMLLSVVASGTYGDEGDNVTWELSDEGVLTISGTGAMKDGPINSSSPWYEEYRESIATVIIEEGVTSIGSHAFVDCINLTEVSVPDTVTKIGSYAFNRCSSLTTIELPDGITAIANYAFNGWTGLTHITLPSGLASIGTYAFGGCVNLERLDIPYGVTSIEISAFSGCTGLQEVILPDSLTDLAAYVFNGCSSLQSIDLPAGITELQTGLFQNCSSLTSVTSRSTITYISTSAFYKCTSLESVFDLSQVSYLGSNAFYECSSLTGTVDLSSLDAIDTHVFDSCTNITEVIFSDQLTSIGNYAFYACNNLGSLSLPEGLQTIGTYAFWNCWLNGDESWATTTVSSGASLYTRDSGETTLTTEELSYTGYTVVIPSSVTSIGTCAFEYSYADVFVIGSNLTSVDGSAFATWSLQAVVFDNFQDLVNITSLATLWSNLNSDHANNNVSVAYRRGGTGIYLNGVTGSDDNDGSKNSPVATFEKAKEIAGKAGLSYIVVTGTVTISDAATWDGGLTLYRDTGFTDDYLIVVSGSGSLTLSDITIDGQNVASSGSLVLVNGDAAQLTITDGAVIQNGALSLSSNMSAHGQGAVCVRNGTLTMNGGQVRNNTGTTFGGGIALLGRDPDTNVHMDFTGGVISGNSSTSSGGGIYLYGNTTLTMAGGTVDGNTAASYGGGIYVGSGAVAEISAGYITNNCQTTNTATYGGGGIYVNQGTTDSAATWPAGLLYLYNVEITDNDFIRGGDIYRGTIACCETGSIEVNITKGAVIHDNSDAKTVMIVRNDGSMTFTLPAIMLGGAAYNWIDYATGEPLDLDELPHSTGNVNALTHVSTSDGTVSGLDRCTTFITGNTSVIQGSAIGTNGNVIIGYNDGDVTIDIEKIWNVNDALPASITVYIDATDGHGITTRIGSVILNEENGWKATIAELPKYDSDGLEYTYSASEELLGGMIGEVVGGKTASSGDDYDTDIDKTASYAFTFTNSSAVELSLTKDAQGTRAPETFQFEITLAQDGAPFNGDVTASFIISSGDIRSDRTGVVSFENGTATVEIQSGETVALLLPTGLTCSITELTTGADTVVVTDGNGNMIASIEGTETQAVAEIGTIHASTQVIFTNSYREYYPIDEEIVPDENDRASWVKDESVNEYNAIEIEMSTYLPVITTYDLTYGAYTMNFHEQLNSQLNLDEADADFSVAIAGQRIAHQYYTVTIDPDDGCTFHVDVDLTALYNDGIISEEDLQGTTEIMVFFFADLEGTGLNGTYESTVWYDVYDGDEILYTSNIDVVYVYTYEIEILKVDTETGEALSGATLGVYYDRELTDPVIRYGEPYTVTSGDDGYAMFYGLAEGTYYIAEVAAPEGYVLSSDVLEAVLNANTVDANYIYSATFSNTSTPDGETPEPKTTVDITVVKVWDDNDDLYGARPDMVVVVLLQDGKATTLTQLLSDENGWCGTFSDLPEYSDDGEKIVYTIAEVTVPNYSSTLTGDQESGFTVTNTYDEPTTPEPDTPEPGNPEPGTPEPSNPEPGNPEPMPQTGQNSLPIVPLALAGAAIVAAGAGALVIWRRRAA